MNLVVRSSSRRDVESEDASGSGQRDGAKNPTLPGPSPLLVVDLSELWPQSTALLRGKAP